MSFAATGTMKGSRHACQSCRTRKARFSSGVRSARTGTTHSVLSATEMSGSGSGQGVSQKCLLHGRSGPQNSSPPWATLSATAK